MRSQLIYKTDNADMAHGCAIDTNHGFDDPSLLGLLWTADFELLDRDRWTVY